MAVANRAGVVDRLLVALTLSFALMIGARPAMAAVYVVSPADASPSIERVELAASVGAVQTTLWCAVHVRRSTRFAIVAGVPAQASIGAGLDAWLLSLDVVSAPRIVAPKDTASNPCRRETPPLFEPLERRRGVPASSALLIEPEALASTLRDWGLPEISSPAASDELLYAALFELGLGGGTNQIVRIQLEAGSGELPFVHTPGWADIPITTYFLAPGSANPGPGSVFGRDVLEVTYRVPGGSSDYADLVQSLLHSHSGAAWLLESSVGLAAELYTSGVMVPGLVGEYFRSAAASGEVKASPSLCADQVLARLSGNATALDGGCAAGDDVELAFEGMLPDVARVTRHASFSGNGSPSFVEVDVTQGPVVPPVHEAAKLEAPSCGGTGVVTAPVPQIPGTPGETESEAEEGSSLLEIEVGFYDYGTSEPEPVESCGSSPGEESEDCDGDTTGTDDSYSGDTCSSDQSDSYDGESCDSGESSDSYDGESCDSGESSDSYDDESCSSDESSDDSEGCSSEEPGNDDSYSGDTCDSDSSAARANAAPFPRARIARGQKLRPRLSVLTLALSALLLAARRVRRRTSQKK